MTDGISQCNNSKVLDDPDHPTVVATPHPVNRRWSPIASWLNHWDWITLGDSTNQTAFAVQRIPNDHGDGAQRGKRLPYEPVRMLGDVSLALFGGSPYTRLVQFIEPGEYMSITDIEGGLYVAERLTMRWDDIQEAFDNAYDQIERAKRGLEAPYVCRRYN